MSLPSLCEVVPLEKILLSQCILADGNSFIERVVVFNSVIIVLVGVLHFVSSSMSVSSGTTSPLFASFLWSYHCFLPAFSPLRDTAV